MKSSKSKRWPWFEICLAAALTVLIYAWVLVFVIALDEGMPLPHRLEEVR